MTDGVPEGRPRKYVWSDEQDALLIQLFADGADYNEMVRQVGHSQEMVQKRLKLLVLKSNPDAPISIGEASSRFAADGQRILRARKLG